MPEHVTTIRVRYAETDQMGIVYYANYLIWMEVARTALCRSLGFHYREMEGQDGILLAVAEANCRYLSPARYDDEVAVSTTISESNRRFLAFAYEMSCEGRRLASGFTRHVYLSRDLRPVRLPDKYMSLFGDIA